MPLFEQLKKDFYKSKRGQRVRFGIFLVLNFGNVLSDWLLYRSVALIEEGLVFGPNVYEKDVLVFTTLGSITVFPEVCLDWAEIIMDKASDIFEGLRAAIIIVTDIPLMILNMIMIECIDEDNTYYQMAKAIVIVIGAFIRFFLSWLKVNEKKEAGTSKKKMIGLLCRKQCVIMQFILAVTLFVTTQTKSNSQGGKDFMVPHAILKGELDDSQYFTNVSIYFSHPYLDYKTNYSEHNINFIRLLSIYDLKNSMTDQSVNIHYDSTHTNFLVQISGESDQCFQNKKKTVTMATNCSSDEPPNAGRFAFTFHYVKPSSPRLLYGDITFNMRIGNNTNCETPDFPVVDDMEAHIGDPSSVFLHYFKTKANITEESSLKRLSNSSYEFYQLSDLINIEDIWRDNSCRGTSSQAPHRDEGLVVKCL